MSAEFFKKYMLFIGGALAAIPIGVYFMYKYSKRIGAEEYLPVEPEQKESKSSVSTTTTNTQINTPNVSEAFINDILKRMSEHIFNTVIMAYDVLKEDYDRTTNKFSPEKASLKDISGQQFRAAIIQNVLIDNQAFIKDAKISNEDYLHALKFYLNEKPVDKIRKKSDFIQNLLVEFQKDDSFKVNITMPKEISENYLKILTNTFYLTLMKSAIQIKDLISTSNMTQEELADKVAKFYQTNLIEVRKKILEFYKVKDIPDMRAITLVRSYVYTLSKKDLVRQKHEHFLNILGKVEENLSKKIIPVEFIDNTNEYYCEEVQDGIINMDRLILNTIDLSNLTY